jgi:5-methylcytosine-specific restriction endonuclease McrA
LLPVLESAGWIQIERATGSVQSRHTILLGPACHSSKPQQWNSYQEYLDSEWWQRRRARTMQADEYSCRLCSSTESLNVHHRSYERLGCERDQDVITLCRDCHAKFHGGEGGAL